MTQGVQNRSRHSAHPRYNRHDEHRGGTVGTQGESWNWEEMSGDGDTSPRLDWNGVGVRKTYWRELPVFTLECVREEDPSDHIRQVVERVHGVPGAAPAGCTTFKVSTRDGGSVLCRTRVQTREGKWLLRAVWTVEEQGRVGRVQRRLAASAGTEAAWTVLLVAERAVAAPFFTFAEALGEDVAAMEEKSALETPLLDTGRVMSVAYESRFLRIVTVLAGFVALPFVLMIAAEGGTGGVGRLISIGLMMALFAVGVVVGTRRRRRRLKR